MDTIVINRSNPLQCRVEAATYRLDAGERDGAASFCAAKPYGQVREESEYYVPEFLRNPEYVPRPGLYAAAQDHARHLLEAERLVDTALILSQVLRASLLDAADERAMQAETVLEFVEQQLDRARLQLDKHDARHANLFMAYVELKDSEPKNN